MSRTSPRLWAFLSAFIAAPLIIGGAFMLFTYGGEYGTRFARVGILGLLAMMPGYLLAFGILAWRALKQGAREVKVFIFAGLWANALHLLFFPAVIMLSAAMGLLEPGAAASLPVGADAAAMESVQDATLGSAVFAGFVVFFLGLFFMPPITALCGMIYRRLDKA